MSTQKSAIALRTLLCDTTDQLRSTNSVILPDGSTVFVAQTKTLYRLDKAAGTALDTLGIGLVVKPADQSDARWIAESVEGSSPWFGAAGLNGFTTVAMSALDWQYLGNVLGNYVTNYGDPAVFFVNPASGAIVYFGPRRTFKLSAKLSLYNGASPAAIVVSGCISINGDVVVGTTTPHDDFGQMSVETDGTIPGVIVELSTDRLSLLNPGDSIRMALRNPINGDDLSISFYQLTATPI